MKRIAISLVLAAVALLSCRAAGGNDSYWGLRLSYELAAPGDVKLNDVYKKDLYGNGSGFSLGAVYHVPVIYNFYFEPGVELYYNTYSLNKSAVNSELNSSAAAIGFECTGASTRMWGLRVPVVGGYRFDLFSGFALSVFTGPEFNLGLSAKNHVKAGVFSATSSAYGGDGTLNRVDIKWRFGVGATFSEKVYGAISGAVGMCDQSQGRQKMHSNLFDITLGYNF